MGGVNRSLAGFLAAGAVVQAIGVALYGWLDGSASPFWVDFPVSAWLDARSGTYYGMEGPVIEVVLVGLAVVFARRGGSLGPVGCLGASLVLGVLAVLEILLLGLGIFPLMLHDCALFSPEHFHYMALQFAAFALLSLLGAFLARAARFVSAS